MLFIGALSLLYSGLFSEGIKLDRINSLAEYKGKLFDPIFLYISGSIIFTKPKNSHKALLILTCVYGVLNILALGSFISGINFLGREILSHRGQRFSSYGPIANQGAYALAFLMPLLYYFFSQGKHLISKVYYISSVFFCIIGIMLTGSRGAYLLVPVQVIGFSLLNRNLRLLIFSIVSGLAAFGILFALKPNFVMGALNRMSIFQASNLYDVSSGRTMIWDSILKVMNSQPVGIVTGVGWGTYRAHLHHLIGSSPAAHNYYLKVWLELGMTGLTVLFTGITVYCYKFRKMAHKVSPIFFHCAACAIFALFWNTMLASLESFLLYYAWFIGLMTNHAANLMKEAEEA